MTLAMAPRAVAEVAPPPALRQFQQELDPAWIDAALAATGTATLRRRRLPAEQVVWLVLGMALYGVDGTTLRVADAPANRAHFGGHAGPGGPAGRGDIGYPLLRVAALMARRSHLIAAASFGPFATSELRYATALWPHVPAHSLTLVDRHYLAATTLLPLARDGVERHWLVRAKANTRATPVKALGAGDTLVEPTVSPYARRADPTLPPTWRARALTYQRAGADRVPVLRTSLLDPVRYPAAELIALYHERWELELGYDELRPSCSSARRRCGAGVPPP